MSRETLTRPEVAEPELQRIIEAYRDNPISTLESYVQYSDDGTPESVASREQAKIDFLANRTINPKLEYPVLDSLYASGQLEDAENYLLGYMSYSVDLAYDTDRELTLYDILRLKLLEVYMLQISEKISETDDPNARAELADMFNLANDEVYGKIETASFTPMLGESRQLAKNIVEGDPESEASSMARYILDNTGDVPYQESNSNQVSEEVITRIRSLLIAANADILACVPEKPEGEKLTTRELVTMFEKAHNVRQTGWDVMVREGQTIINSEQDQKITNIGANRKPLTTNKAAQILLHENGVHVERRRQGDVSGDPLLEGLGLPSLVSEEGLAKAFEQVYAGKQTSSGVTHYIELGLAKGLDGQGPRDFRGVFELEWRRFALEDFTKAQVKEMNPEIIEKARDTAYRMCLRIFRGTPCDIPGMVYTKDQSYFVGDQQAWAYLTEISGLPDEELHERFDQLFFAKHDMNNPVHRRLVEKAAKGVRYVS